MIEYGLIGERLGHSFSKLIHEELCGYSYQLCELPTEKLFSEFMHKKAFKAINVTIPYKEKVLPFCAYIDEHAKEIGAVNTIVNDNGILKGYNTDFAGLSYMIEKAGVTIQGKTVLLLGTGGTYKTARAVCRSQNAAKILTASRTKRSGALTYSEALNEKDVQIIINTSPVGMYPDNSCMPIDINAFSRLTAVLDVVYNPLETKIVCEAREKGLLAANGLSMLVAQAVFAARHFLNKQIPLTEIKRVESWLSARQLGLVLIGMPSCGKTSIGVAVSKTLSKSFIDTDEIIEADAQMPISQIFAQMGEGRFRDLEAEVIKRECALGGRVISSGGGSVLRPENVKSMRQNSIVIYIKRPIESLITGGARPLSKSREALLEMQLKREPLYNAAAHAIIENNSSFEDAVQRVTEAFYEIAGN